MMYIKANIHNSKSTPFIPLPQGTDPQVKNLCSKGSW